jgi:hypothetical protein
MDGGRSGGKYRVDGVYLWALASWDVQVRFTSVLCWGDEHAYMSAGILLSQDNHCQVDLAS